MFRVAKLLVRCSTYVQVFASLESVLNFSVVLTSPEDEEWGVRRRGEDGRWYFSGMVGQLAAGEADVSIGGLTINAERQEAVDFTVGIVQVHRR